MHRHVPADYESWDEAPTDEAATRLRDVVGQVGDKLRYEYDFGDSWEHEIVVEDVLTEKSTTCARSWAIPTPSMPNG
ncbi:MAG: IS1096 element passenger TnpR family protein [Acidimicrobiales bacterium]